MWTLLWLLYICCSCTTSVQGYVLTDHFVGSNFFNNFNFFDNVDPSHGYVNYVSSQNAKAKGLVHVTSNSSVYIGCDSTNIAVGLGRDSVRLESKHKWTYGLFVMDLTHMPTGCGTWPAWWLYGPNWPYGGEIDIIEGVNQQTADQTTLHTSYGCTNSQNFTLYSGIPTGAGDDCNNNGCGIVAEHGTFGAPFNKAQGGVFALEWTENYIQNFFWEREYVPMGILLDTPDPSNWGEPYAYFELGESCPSSHFYEHTMVINTNFCGDWAGAVFSSQCPGFSSCTDYVKSTPAAFTEAYWNINYIKVYQNSTHSYDQSNAPTIFHGTQWLTLTCIIFVINQWLM